jgi:lipoprotein-releasing system permease protein
VAWRYLRARRKEAFISVIAGFSFIGIMLGVATLIIVMAVMNGFRTELLISRILGINGHMIVQPMDGPFTTMLQCDRPHRCGSRRQGGLPLIEGQTLASGNAGCRHRERWCAASVKRISTSSRPSPTTSSQGDIGRLCKAGRAWLIGSRMADQLGLQASATTSR